LKKRRNQKTRKINRVSLNTINTLAPSSTISNGGSHPSNEIPQWTKWEVITDYAGLKDDEMTLRCGEILFVSNVYEDGWAIGKSASTSTT
jgi:hypothetical protein